MAQFAVVDLSVKESTSLTVGAVVLYKLSEQDAKKTRYDGPHGKLMHRKGEVLPLIVARIWPDEFGVGVPGLNGQVILDSPLGFLWVCSVREGNENGQWSFR